MPHIRQLDPTDAAALQSLWLRALREHPEAFAAAFEDEQQRTLESVAQQLAVSRAGALMRR